MPSRSLAELVFLTQALSTLFMTGLIWFVQVVHYPLFALVKSDHPRYAAQHQTRTGWVVMPLMLAELFSSALSLFARFRIPAFSYRDALIGIILLAIIWLSTALLQVPLHRQLATSFKPVLIHRLVAGNWIRTVAWSARCALIASCFIRLMEQR